MDKSLQTRLTRVFTNSCFYNHAPSAYSQPNLAPAELKLHAYCREAGSYGQSIIDQQRTLQRRQFGSFLNGVASFFSSVFDPHTAAPATPAAHTPTPQPNTPNPPARTSAKNTPTQPSAKPQNSTPTPQPTSNNDAPTSSAQAPSPTSTDTKAPDTRSRRPDDHSATSSSDGGFTSNVEPTFALASSTSSATPAPAKSGPSGGVIAGAVIGSIFSLSVIGLLVILILRYKQDKSIAKAFKSDGQEDGAALHRKALSVETTQSKSNATIIDDDKDVYYMHEQTPTQPRGDESHTYADVQGTAHGNPHGTVAWELDSLERPAPVELEAPIYSPRPETIPESPELVQEEAEEARVAQAYVAPSPLPVCLRPGVVRP